MQRGYSTHNCRYHFCIKWLVEHAGNLEESVNMWESADKRRKELRRALW